MKREFETQHSRRVDPVAERINKLPYMVQGYISLGKVKRQPDLDESTKRRLSQAQRDTYRQMSPEEQLALHDFGKFMQEYAQSDEIDLRVNPTLQRKRGDRHGKK